jgi:tetratricopeptide (TPR) repeat protein
MAVHGRRKAIRAGRLELYDVVADAAEARDLAATSKLPAAVDEALRSYPLPPLDPSPAQDALGEEERRKLASLGYVGTAAAPVVRPDAPRPADQAHLFGLLDEASSLFVREEYARALPLLEKILAKDPHNLDAALRLATAHSSLGHPAQALAAFQRASRIAPRSQDVTTYIALHHARGPDWPRAVPLLEQVVAEAPNRLPAVEALAVVREKQGRIAEAVALRQRIHRLRTPSAAELVRLGQLAMAAQDTASALVSFEAARGLQGPSFTHDLELGVLYLDARRLEQARDALERVRPSSPGYAMALFKRAQVSVLLREPDRAARIDAARRAADPTTRRLIESERLFR